MIEQLNEKLQQVSRDLLEIGNDIDDEWELKHFSEVRARILEIESRLWDAIESLPAENLS